MGILATLIKEEIELVNSDALTEVKRFERSSKPRVEILFCAQCRWFLQAGWYAQEFLSTFSQEMGEVALVPGSGDVFQVRVDGELVWDRKKGGLPGANELKQKVRDRIAPDRSLGHTDRA